MMELKIKIETEESIYDDFNSVSDQYWYKKSEELDSAKRQIYEQLQKTLPTKLKKLTLDEIKKIETDGDKFDIDKIATGINHSQHERMRLLISIIQKESSKQAIIKEAVAKGIEQGKVEEAIDRLKRNGQIYEPTPNTFKVTEF